MLYKCFTNIGLYAMIRENGRAGPTTSTQKGAEAMGHYELTVSEYRAMLERETGESWGDASDEAICAVMEQQREESAAWDTFFYADLPIEQEQPASTEPCLSCIFHDCESCGAEAVHARMLEQGCDPDDCEGCALYDECHTCADPLPAGACPTCGEWRPEFLALVGNDWMTGPRVVMECQTCGQAFSDQAEQ